MELDGRLSRHFWLTQGMARSIGVDINGALRCGALKRDDYAQMVASCCDCDQSARCIGWMAKQGAGARSLPEFCPIKTVLEQIQL